MSRTKRSSKKPRSSSEPADPVEDFFFDQEEADRIEDFFKTCLRHVKGEWSGQPFELLEWEAREVIRPLFGWRRVSDGSRRYRTCYVEIPRKNGKSTLAAGIALALLFADFEMGAEVYSAAGDREQAAIVFSLAHEMVQVSPMLRERSESFRRSITVPGTGSFYKVLSSDAYTKHGLNAHAVIVDELHVQRNRDLWDALVTSTGSRRQPMVVAITTAGYDRHSLCWEQHDYARKVKEGVIEDPYFLPVIYFAADEDDWTDEAVWKKCNPGYGVTVKPEYLRAACERAQKNPAEENTFRRLHLNQWVKQESRWMPMAAWQECATAPQIGQHLPVDWHPPMPPPRTSVACYSGLDLASNIDVTALVHVFEPDPDGVMDVLARFFIPEDHMRERVRRDQVPYDLWAKQGFLTLTPGNVIDYDFILRTLDEDARQFDIRELAFDRWGATKVIQEIQDQGLVVVPFGQGFASMGPPTKELLTLVLAKKIRHGGNPVLHWMADNVVVEQDAAGLIKPSKRRAKEKIDGIVALIMALDRCLRHETHRSVYEDRGVVEV